MALGHNFVSEPKNGAETVPAKKEKASNSLASTPSLPVTTRASCSATATGSPAELAGSGFAASCA